MTEDRLIKVRALLVANLCFQPCVPHPERELCTNGVANSDIASSAGYASVTVCRRDERRGRQSLRGARSCRSAPHTPHTHLPCARSSVILVSFRKVRRRNLHNLDLQTSRNRPGCASIHQSKRSMIMLLFVPSCGKSSTNSNVPLTHPTLMTHIQLI